ncbi:MAG: hypothetical protein IKS84_06420, partial [Lachnospiraceae bacterium]|nr:hypothetical protein [Lachnospiraceae bacterium]
MNRTILDDSQVKRINRLLLIVLIITSVFAFAGLMSQLSDAEEMAPFRSILPAVLVIINLIASIVVSRVTQPQFLHIFVAYGFTIVYAAMLLLSQMGTVFPYLIPIMIIV